MPRAYLRQTERRVDTQRAHGERESRDYRARSKQPTDGQTRVDTQRITEQEKEKESNKIIKLMPLFFSFPAMSFQGLRRAHAAYAESSRAGAQHGGLPRQGAQPKRAASHHGTAQVRNRPLGEQSSGFCPVAYPVLNTRITHYAHLACLLLQSDRKGVDSTRS